ncbi:MAG TPA: zinc-ribbon domain-containing protein, partial [Pyrinomonadaceae bacterium]|nr:zinc-ribbon domain-containing protein [Pyrinomonadaceae bacterium]
MTTCHQCGSEVAQNDAFCPHCGISLAPIAVPSSENDEFASTIIMPTASAKPPEIPLAEEQASAPIEESSGPEPISAADEQPEVDEESPTVTAEPIPVTPEPAVDYENVPTPPALEELERSAAEPAPPAAISETESSFADSEQSETDSEPVLAHSEFEPPLEETEQVPISQYEPEPEPAWQTATSEPIVESKESDEPVPIAPPSEVLETPELAPSMFDSVRIMDDRYTPTSARPASESSTPAEPAERKSSAGLRKSHTASGIGMVDTDGRRSAKLKPLDEGVILNGRYEIVRKIGGGGMGAVYLASDNNLG